MKFAVMQIAPKKFVVGETPRGTVFRKVCECPTEYGAKRVKDALILAYDKPNGDEK